MRQRLKHWLWLVLAINALVQADSDNVASANRAPLVLENLPAVSQPLDTTAKVADWLRLNKQEYGFHADSELQISPVVDTQEKAASEFRSYRIQQSLKGIPVYLHQSVLLTKKGQPDSFYLNSSDLIYDRYDDAVNLQSVAEIFLTTSGVQVLGDWQAEKIYWRQGDRLLAALRLTGALGTPDTGQLADYIIELNGQLLDTFIKEYADQYHIVDVDQICRANKAIGKFVSESEIFKAVFSRVAKGQAVTSPAVATTSDTKTSAELFEQALRFLNTKFHQGLSSKGAVEFPVALGTWWSDVAGASGINCTGSGFNASWGMLTSSSGHKQGYMQIQIGQLQHPDTIMHEFSHGIVSYSSDLIYRDESGALNEAFADAVGVSFKMWLRGREHSPQRQDWFKGTARDFKEPAKKTYPLTASGRYPDHYDNRYRGADDNGGVHGNSSIINHAYYLLAEGGSHGRLGGKPVTKIGVEKALNIWFLAVTEHFTPTTNFANARLMFAKAAERLYGKHGTEWQAVHEAMDAVGVRGNWSLPKAAPPAPEIAAPEVKEPQIQKPEVKAPEVKPPVTKTPAPEPTQPQLTSNDSSGLVWAAVIAAGLMIMGILTIIKRARPEGAEVASYQTAYQSKIPPDPVIPPVPDFSRDGLILEASGRTHRLNGNQLAGKGVLLGRSNRCDIMIDNPSVSSMHARLTAMAGQFYLEDLGSSYGTAINGIDIAKHQPIRVEVPGEFSLADLVLRLNPLLSKADHQQSLQTKEQIKIRLRGKGLNVKLSSQHASQGYCLGRSEDADVVINHPSVSSRHGRVVFRDGHWYYEDLGSSYGSRLEQNDNEVVHESIEAGESICLIPDSRLLLADYELSISSE